MDFLSFEISLLPIIIFFWQFYLIFVGSSVILPELHQHSLKKWQCCAALTEARLSLPQIQLKWKWRWQRRDICLQRIVPNKYFILFSRPWNYWCYYICRTNLVKPQLGGLWKKDLFYFWAKTDRHHSGKKTKYINCLNPDPFKPIEPFVILILE